MNYQEFLDFYREFPNKENKYYYNRFKNANKDTIRSYKSRAKKSVSRDASPKQKILNNNSSQPPQNIIDDPDELLMSVAIRELNRQNPDPRWASILISCKKENISNKSEVLDKFKQLPTQTLVNILSKSLQKEPL